MAGSDAEGTQEDIAPLRDRQPYPACALTQRTCKVISRKSHLSVSGISVTLGKNLLGQRQWMLRPLQECSLAESVFLTSGIRSPCIISLRTSGHRLREDSCAHSFFSVRDMRLCLQAGHMGRWAQTPAQQTSGLPGNVFPSSCYPGPARDILLQSRRCCWEVG